MLVMPYLGMAAGSDSYDVRFTARTIHTTVVDPLDATAALKLGTDGQAYRSGLLANGYINISGEWLFPLSGIAADQYECFATLDSGVLGSGTTGSWLALTADREWTITCTSVGTETATITVAIRRIGTTNNLASAQIILLAEVTV